MTLSAATRHDAQQHRTVRAGVEAISVVSTHHFPRHAHDQLGLGLMDFGGHRTWSAHGEIEAAAGDVIAVNPGEIHDGAPLGKAERGWRMLYFDPTFVASELSEDADNSLEITRSVLRDPLLRRLLEQLFATVTATNVNILAVDEAVVQTLTLVSRRHGSRSPCMLGASPAVAQAQRRLDEAPEVQITLAELAAIVGVSRFQLLRGFSRDLGTTPHAYLLQQRVRLARRLLGERRGPAEAAAEAGFADQSHMTRAFARQFGVTPGRYRAAIASHSRNPIQDP
jgi:AraC-like DNA-binding protein